MKRWGKPLLLCIGLLLAVFLFTSCNISLSKTQTIPPTPTLQPAFPEVTVIVTPGTEVIENPTETPMAEEAMTGETESEEAGAEDAKDVPTETPAAEATATPEVVAEAKEVVVEETLATATRIPPIANANPDAIVFFSKAVGCYQSPDVNSYNFGTVLAGTAGQAFARIGNFYQVSHPNQARIVCWVVGDGVLPNTPAYNLPESAGTTNEIPLTTTAVPTATSTAVPTATNTAVPTSTPVSATTTITPTVIPANSNANPDATVFFDAVVGCYQNADLTSANLGNVPAGTAGQAFARTGNFYRVSHPARPGVICWVTGDGVSPNWPAFNLGN